MTQRLFMAVRGQRPHPRLPPIPDRLLRQTRLGVVMGQQFRLALGGVRKARLQSLGNLGVVLPPAVFEKRLISCVPYQRLFEPVAHIGRRAVAVEQTRLDELGQGLVQLVIPQGRHSGQQSEAELLAERRRTS